MSALGHSNGGDVDAELDALFARARAYPPAPAQLQHMLRSVREAQRDLGRVWKLGGALLGAAAIVAAAVVLLSPNQPQALAMSRVAAAMRDAPVVQATSGNGDTVWEGPDRFFAYRLPRRGEYVYHDYASETMATYDETRGCVMLSTCEAPEVPRGRTGAYSLAELIQEAESWGQSFAQRWERTDRIDQGRPAVELCARNANHGAQRIGIDGTSGRILWTVADGLRTDYSYPNEAPRDLYDLGVPRSARVVDGRAPAAALALRDAVRAQRGHDFGAYRMVAVDSVGGMGTIRMITDGRRYRLDYVDSDDQREHTVDELRAIAQQYDHMAPLGGQARQSYVLTSDAETSVVFDADGAVRSRSVRPRELAFIGLHTLETKVGRGDETAFFGAWGDQQCEYLGPDERGWVGVRVRGQASGCSRPYLRDAWYDPQHGLAPCLTWGYDDPQAEWQLRSNWQEGYLSYRTPIVRPAPDAPPRGFDREALEWAELRPGEWYPTVTRSRSLERTADGTWQLYRVPNCDTCHAVSYEVIIATPLESVDNRWFEIPAEWLAVPAHEPP